MDILRKGFQLTNQETLAGEFGLDLDRDMIKMQNNHVTKRLQDKGDKPTMSDNHLNMGSEGMTELNKNTFR